MAENNPYRKEEIVGAARRMFISRGYDRTSIQELINELGIAKGTFYHHFASKVELLDALVKEMSREIMARLTPIADRSDLGPAEKLNRIFLEGGLIKMEPGNIEIVLAVMKTFAADENLPIRHRMQREVMASMTGLTARILREGMEAGVFRSADPERMAGAILALGVQQQELYYDLFRDFSAESYAALLERMAADLDFYARSVEILLGLAPGTLRFYDDSIVGSFRQSLDAHRENTQ